MISITNTIFALAAFQAANAALFVTFPVQGSTCVVGTGCQIRWIDNVNAAGTPLRTLGEVSIDLVAGDPSNLQTVQHLGGITDPFSALAITFTPNGNLSPTQPYAIRFIPKASPAGVIFSTFFHITGGTGTGIIPGSGIALKSASSLVSVSSNSSALASTSNTTANSTSSVKSVSSNATTLSPSSALHNSTSAVNSTASTAASKSSSSLLQASFRAVAGVAAFSLCLLL